MQAYSILSVKAIDEERRTFSGTATTPTPDAVDDVIEPLGVEFDNPAPLLLFHDVKMPVGSVVFQAPTAAGVDFVASIPVVKEPGILKDRVDEAWHSVKYRMITAVSVKVVARSADVKKRASGGLHWLRSRIKELSLVTIPANADATIAVVKSLDRPAAPGTGPDRLSTSPGVSGSLRVVQVNARGPDAMKTITEQIASYKSTRDAKFTEMNTMVQAAAEAGLTFDAQQDETYETLKGDVDALDKHIKRLEDFNVSNVASAVAVKGTTSADASASRGRSTAVSVKSALDPSLGFARVAMCIAASKGIGGEAIRIAEMNFGQSSDVVEAVKTAVGAATTSNNQGPAVQYADYAEGFIDYLRAKTILDKFGSNGIPALRRVPFNTRVSTQTAGATAGWVGEGKPKPLSKGTFGTTTLDFSKIAVICALTKEEIRFGVSGAEAKVRDDMARAIAAGIDLAFIDPSNAGTSNVKPAAITYNVAASAVSGTTPAAAQLDIANMLQTMISAGIQGDSLVLIMTQGIAMKLGLARNSLGNRINPELSMRGGFFEGYPVIVSEALTSLGSPTANMIVAVNAQDIFLADDGNVAIDASEQASLQMDDAPGTQDGTTGTGTSLVSLWQTNMLGLRAEREIAWKVTRSAAVQYLSGVNYSVA
jgi:HK97 family phage major capsid protein